MHEWSKELGHAVQMSVTEFVLRFISVIFMLNVQQSKTRTCVILLLSCLYTNKYLIIYKRPIGLRLHFVCLLKMFDLIATGRKN